MSGSQPGTVMLAGAAAHQRAHFGAAERATRSPARASVSGFLSTSIAAELRLPQGHVRVAVAAFGGFHADQRHARLQREVVRDGGHRLARRRARPFPKDRRSPCCLNR